MVPSSSTDKIVFFDGLCGLCNGFVDFVMRHDKAQAFRFSPLQSEFAKMNLPPEFTVDLKTVVVLIDGNVYKKSKAVFLVFHHLGFPWSFVSWLRFLPEGLLNFGYDMVAANRYRLFGKKETCRLPTPSERQRFIL